jgi:hypothetical protein
MVPSHPLKDGGVPVIVEITEHLNYFPILNYMTTMMTAYTMDCLYTSQYMGNPHLSPPKCNTHSNMIYFFMQ